MASGDTESWEARVAGLKARLARLERTLAARDAEIARKDGFIPLSLGGGWDNSSGEFD